MHCILSCLRIPSEHRWPFQCFFYLFISPTQTIATLWTSPSTWKLVFIVCILSILRTTWQVKCVVSRETMLPSLLKSLQRPVLERRNALAKLSVLWKVGPICSRFTVFLLKVRRRFYLNQKWTKWKSIILLSQNGTLQGSEIFKK